MSKHGNYFKFNLRWVKSLSVLSPAARGAVYDAVFEYVETGTMPKLEGDVALTAFQFIKDEIDEELARVAAISERRSAAKKRDWDKRKGNVSEQQEPLVAAAAAPQPDTQGAVTSQEQYTPSADAATATQEAEQQAQAVSAKAAKAKQTPRWPDYSTTSSTYDPKREETLFDEVWSQSSWCNNVMENYGIKYETLVAYYKTFFQRCQRGLDEHRTVKDLQQHFVRWLRMDLRPSTSPNKPAMAYVYTQPTTAPVAAARPQRMERAAAYIDGLLESCRPTV